MRIGVFDSGKGGAAVAARLAELLPLATIISIDDHEHMPYGTKPAARIIELTIAAVQPLIAQTCDVIVIACNTATTVAITSLRLTYPTVHFIGIEPMVKPAALLSKTGIIAICATPGTLASARYVALKEKWGVGVTIIEPDCQSWAELIEHGYSDTLDIESTVKKLVEQGVDSIVLGCTHYHLIKDRIMRAVGQNVTILEPSDAIASRIKNVLS